METSLPNWAALARISTSRLIKILEDKKRIKSNAKYMVIEWIEGHQLNWLSQNELKNCSFKNEIDFLRMMFVLLNELNFLHQKNILHRDIKTENIMWIERNEKIDFILIEKFASNFNQIRKFLFYEKLFRPFCVLSQDQANVPFLLDLHDCLT